MELHEQAGLSADINDSPEVVSWLRPRTTDELMGFISRREAVVFADATDELFG